MKKAKLAELLDLRLGRLHALRARMRNGLETEDVHAWRLEVKKLRALLQFCFGDRGKHTGLPPEIRKLYQCLGEFRNLQLQLERVHAWFRGRGPVQYMRRLEVAAAQAAAEAGVLLAGTAAGAEEAWRGRFLSAPSPGVRRARRYLQEQFRLCRKLAGRKSDAGLHRLRKVIKELHYNKTVLLLVLPGMRDRLPDGDSMKAIMDLLGDNQDYFTALAYLQGDYLRGLPDAEHAQLLDLTLALAAKKLHGRDLLSQKLKKGLEP